MTALKYIIPILWMTLSYPVQAADAPRYSVQIFGDFFWPHSAEAKQPPDAHDVLSELIPVLQSADLNVVNFEGVATDALMPHVLKSHLLRMATTVGGFLHEHKVRVATLANNHSMDFGAQGLFDSLSVFRPRVAATEQENKVTAILKSGTSCHLKTESQIYECALKPF